MSLSLKKGVELNLEIETLAFGGRGVARADGFVIFVDGALPGQNVHARILRKRKAYAEARTLEITKASLDEVEPRCSHFGECGGCRFQNLDYSAQLKYKRHHVIESLERIGGFCDLPVSDVIASPEQFYYRNKMEYSFGRQRWLTREEINSNKISKPRDSALGLHVRGRFDKILDIDECYLQSPSSVEILNSVREFVLEGKIPLYSTQDHTGFWRHLVIREGKNTQDILINLVTADDSEYDKDVQALASRLSMQFPQITTIVHNINRGKAQVAVGDEERILFGPGTIKEKIGTRLYQISANSFFQTNTRGAEVLYDKVTEFAGFQGDEIVYDLYSGAGTIALYIADRVREVVGFEVIEAAVKDGFTNCQLNGIENCSFVLGDLKESLQMSLEGLPKWGYPDTVIIDPPRTGMHPDVVNQLLELRPKKIVYVSCNPTTFARDAKEVCRFKYVLQKVQPVDMFPMTPHIELIGLLKRA